MKLKSILTSALLTCVMCVNTFASGISVFYNDEQVSFADAQPKIINGRTMVPIRGLFEKMGYQISWDNISRIATLTSRHLIISAGESLLYAQKPGTSVLIPITSDAMPIISEGRLYLPLRSISQATGCSVNWNQDTRTVDIKTMEVSKSSDDEDEDAVFSKEGNMTSDVQLYLTTVFDTLSEIKTQVTTTKNPTLMKLYKLSKTNSVNATGANCEHILSLANSLKGLNAPDTIGKIKSDVDAFAYIIEQACTAEQSGNGDITAQINDLINKKDTISLSFSQNLVDYFNSYDVSFEQIFSEYCLDAMN